jgi:hypothetical protein
VANVGTVNKENSDVHFGIYTTRTTCYATTSRCRSNYTVKLFKPKTYKIPMSTRLVELRPMLDAGPFLA